MQKTLEADAIRNCKNIFPCLSVRTSPTQSRLPSVKVNVYAIAYIA